MALIASRFILTASLLAAPFSGAFAQNSCFQEQMACNRQCGNNLQCQSEVCFNQAVECQRQQQLQSAQQAIPSQQPAEVQQQDRSYVLPPLEVCASLNWGGDDLWEFTLVNNCPAAVEADVLFSDGAKTNIFCFNYESCQASFPKVQVSDRFTYQMRYATQ